MNRYRELAVYVVTLLIPIALLHLITGFILTETPINAVNIIFPSLAVMGLALELGIGQYIVASRRSFYALFMPLVEDKLVWALYILTVTLVYVLSYLVTRVEDYFSLSIYAGFLAFSLSGIAFSIARSVIDRARSRRWSIIFRVINNLIICIAIVLAYKGFHPFFSFFVCAVARTIMAWPVLMRRVRVMYSRCYALGSALSEYRSLILKLSSAGAVAFLVSGLLFRSIFIHLVPSSAFALYVVISEYAIRAGGFLLNASQPFYRALRAPIQIFDLFFVLLIAALQGIGLSRPGFILAVSSLVFLIGFKLQILMEREMHMLRIFFPITELVLSLLVFITLGSLFDAQDAMVASWLYGLTIINTAVSAYIFLWKHKNV